MFSDLPLIYTEVLDSKPMFVFNFYFFDKVDKRSYMKVALKLGKPRARKYLINF